MTEKPHHLEMPSEEELKKMSPKEILERGLEITRHETIPIASIAVDVSIVDDFHAEKLGDSMRGKRGQLTPICVRARLNENGEVAYDVSDGFHRTEGKRLSGDQGIDATVVYGCDDAELIDLRILAASSVKSVQWPRIAFWINGAWEQTSWFKDDGVTVLQAFSATINKQDSVQKLSAGESAKAKQWVKNKCDYWQRGITNTYGVLRIVGMSDPDLVRQVRAGSGGRDRKAVITPGRLEAIVMAHPGEENYDTQNIIMDQTIQRRLTANETEQFAVAIRKQLDEGTLIEDVDFEKIMKGITLSKGQRPIDIDSPSESDIKAVDIEDEQDDASIAGSASKPKPEKRVLVAGELGAFRQSSDSLLLRDPVEVFGTPEGDSFANEELNDDPTSFDPDAYEGGISNLGFVGGQRPVDILSKQPIAPRKGSERITEEFPAQSQALVVSLKEALDEANRLLEEKELPSEQWFLTANYITEKERLIMKLLFVEFLDMDQVSGLTDMSARQVIQQITSAFRRRYLQDEKMKIIQAKKRVRHKTEPASDTATSSSSKDKQSAAAV